MAGQVLTSWKEIAAYLGKGVRTVQRWESEMDLPIRRPGSDRHIVLAFPAELDEWARQRHEFKNQSSPHPNLQNRHPELKLTIRERQDPFPEMQKLRTLMIALMDSAANDREQATRLIRQCERYLEKNVRQKVPA